MQGACCSYGMQGREIPRSVWAPDNELLHILAGVWFRFILVKGMRKRFGGNLKADFQIWMDMRAEACVRV